MSNLRPELSKKNKYHISKHRYLELRHFCLQYPEWKEEYRHLLWSTGSIIIPATCNCTDLVSENAIQKAVLAEKIDVVEQTCYEVADDLYSYLLKGVTEDVTYSYLRTVMGIPCCRVSYYEMYHKFFYILSQK